MKLKTLALAVMVASSASVLAENYVNESREAINKNYDAETIVKYYDVAGKTDEQIAKRIQYLVDVSDPRTPEERAADLAVKERYKDAIVINTLHVSTYGFGGTSEQAFVDSIRESYENGITVESGTVSSGDARLGGDPVENAKIAKSILAKHDEFHQIHNVQDIYDAKAAGKLGIVYNIQGSDFIDIDTMEEQVKAMKENGVLTANFVYNQKNQFGVGTNYNRTPEDTGLTEAGKELVKMYNKHGIVVDCSHSSDKVCLDAAAITTQPMIASHSNAASLHDVSRNMSDEGIIAIAKTGGFISPTFLGPFMNDRGEAKSADIAEHINHVAEVISNNTDLDGRKHVGFAADYTHTLADAFEVIVRAPDRYPPKSGYATPAEQAYSYDIWGAVPILEEKYGWSEEDIRGVLGENALRVYKQVW